MLQILTSGISGTGVEEVDLSVVGNNVSNSSTTAFKASRVRFEDMLSQTKSSASGPSNTLGGINAEQVGLGVKVEGIDQDMTTGNLNPTNRNLDNAINGEGYFMVADGITCFKDAQAVQVDDTDGAATQNSMTSNPSNLSISYTRDGAFSLDKDGNLLLSGHRVLGYSMTDTSTTNNSLTGQSITDTGAIDYINANAVNKDGVSTIETEGMGTATNYLKTLVIPKEVLMSTDGKTKDAVESFSIGANGLITATLSDGKVAAIGQLAMARFNNEQGLTKVGGNLYQASPNSGDPIIRTGVNDTKPNDSGHAYGSVENGCLEMSNVDLAQEFAEMITASRSFEACGKCITTGNTILQDLVDLIR